jgi:hypothetical protein
MPLRESAARRQRPSWWLYLATASFAGYFVLMVVSNNFPPEGFGATLLARHEGVFVISVAPGSPAELAGVRPGDRQISLGGLAMNNELDLRTALSQMAVRTETVMAFERGDNRFSVSHTPTRRVFAPVGGRDLSSNLYSVLTLGLFFTIVMGLFVALRHPGDPAALVGAWLLASIGCLSAPLWMRGTAATFRALPLPIGALLWPACLSSVSTSAIALVFFWMFPRRKIVAPWLLSIAVLPAAVITAWAGLYLILTVYSPARAVGYFAPNWLADGARLSYPAYYAAGAAIMASRYRTITDLNERRRMRVLLAGALVGAAGLLMIGLAWIMESLPIAPGAVLILLFPLSFAYAIARHRLFDVRVIVRQGVRYALARGLVLSLVPLLAVLLVADLLLHGDQPLISIVRARGWIYAVLAAFAALAYVRRHRWLETLDRRFFRERYYAQQVMREVVDDVRRARSIEEAAPTVVARVGAALHPEFVALLAREAGESRYHAVALAPSAHALPPLSGDSKLVGLLRLLDKPLQVSTADSGWLVQQLPAEETEFIDDARLDLLVPVALGGAGREALLVLGCKRSEEPYGADDLELLSAIAASLGMLLERPAPEPRSEAVLAECPECGRCYDGTVPRCIDDAADLAISGLGRTLANRYTLEWRLGRGGMGTVYEATDAALDRLVAIKVIREELVGDPDAAERFRREARAAAGFAHPNVVTIYDYGVTDDTRAYLVMERLSGRTLREEMRVHGQLSLARTREILRDIGSAVAAAHRRHIVHRDLKPENVYLAREADREVAKILDFGIAKFLPSAAAEPTAMTASGLLVGTMRYMAPEQLAGGDATPLWDLWALTIVAYEMLAGVHPSAGVQAGSLLAAFDSEHWTPIGDHVPAAPHALHEFFVRALAGDPASRPQSAQSLVDQFEAASN